MISHDLLFEFYTVIVNATLYFLTDHISDITQEIDGWGATILISGLDKDCKYLKILKSLTDLCLIKARRCTKS